MSLIIDIGNTRTKIVLIKEGEIFKKLVCTELTIETLLDLKLEYNIDAIIISTVQQNINPKIVNEIIKWKISFIQLSHKTPLPIKNEYNDLL